MPLRKVLQILFLRIALLQCPIMNLTPTMVLKI